MSSVNKNRIRTRKSVVESSRKLKILSIIAAAPVDKGKLHLAGLVIPRVYTPILSTSSRAIIQAARSPTPHFSSLGRFTNSIFEKFQVRPSRISKLNDSEKSFSPNRFDLNQDMTQYTFNEKNKKIKQKQKSFEYRKVTAKNLRIERHQAKIKKFKDIIDEKFRKYQVRSKRKVGVI